MKVKMNCTTRYNGSVVLLDSIIEVDEAVAKRWQDRKIADIYEGEDESPYAGMSAKKLYDVCVEQGLEVEKKKSAKYYIEILETTEAEAEVLDEAGVKEDPEEVKED